MVSHEYIRIWKSLKNIFTPHVTRSMGVPSFCRLKLPLVTYGPIKTLRLLKKSFLGQVKKMFLVLLPGQFLTCDNTQRDI